MRQLVVWRFVQGLLLPPIFAVTVAYIGDEWPPREVAGVAGALYLGIEPRRLLRPVRSRRARRPARLARRLLALDGAHARRAPCWSR